MESTSNMAVVHMEEIETPWDEAPQAASGDEAVSSGAETEQAIQELESRAKVLHQKLVDEGFRAAAPVWDENTQTWDVHVKYEGVSVLVMVEQNDPEFVRVLLPHFMEIEPEDVGPSLIALDLVNKYKKCAKVFLTPKRDGVYASSDFLDDGTIASHLLMRHIAMVVHSAHHFAKAVEEQRAGVR